MGESSIIAGFAWKFAERGLSQLINFILSLVLARLIEPAAYGALALATVFVSILNVFVDSGLGTALVQQKDADDLDFSSVFYFNLTMCLLLYAAAYFGAPLVSRFYENSEMTPIVRAIALIIPAGGLRSIQQAYAERAMRFKKFFLASLPAAVLSGALGLGLALMGYGVWALIAMYVSNSAITTLALWWLVGWRPKFQLSWARLKPLLGFGGKVLGASLLVSGYSNLKQLLVGKVYTPSDLAFYNKGNALPNSIVPVIQNSVTSVLLPTVSRYQNELQRVREMTEKAVRALSAALWPMMVGLAACAEVFVPLVMTEKWLPAVPYMQLFCIEAAIMPVSAMYINSIRAVGRSGAELKLQMMVRIAGILLLLATIRFGPFAVAVSAFLCSVVELGALTAVNRKVLQYPVRQQLKNIFPFAAMAFAMGAVVFFLGKLPLNQLLLLGAQVLSGFAVYLGLFWFFKRDMLREIVSFFRKNGS